MICPPRRHDMLMEFEDSKKLGGGSGAARLPPAGEAEPFPTGLPRRGSLAPLCSLLPGE